MKQSLLYQKCFWNKFQWVRVLSILYCDASICGQNLHLSWYTRRLRPRDGKLNLCRRDDESFNKFMIKLILDKHGEFKRSNEK